MNPILCIFLVSVITPFFFFFMAKPKLTLIGEKLKISIIASFIWVAIPIFMDPEILSAKHREEGSLYLAPFFITALLFCYTTLKDKQKRKEIAPTKAHRIGITLIAIGSALSVLSFVYTFIYAFLNRGKLIPFYYSLYISIPSVAFGILLLSGLFNKFIHWILKGD